MPPIVALKLWGAVETIQTYMEPVRAETIVFFYPGYDDVTHLVLFTVVLSGNFLHQQVLLYVFRTFGAETFVLLVEIHSSDTSWVGRDLDFAYDGLPPAFVFGEIA